MRSLKKALIKVLKFIKIVIDKDYFGMAAEMGFWLMLGIFPTILFLTVFFSWVGKGSFINSVLIFLSKVIPADSMNLIHKVIEEATVFNNGRIIAIIGLCITLFLSTNAVACIMKGLNRAYNVEETRSFLYTRALSLLMVFVNAFVLFLSINLILFGKFILRMLVIYGGLSHSAYITLLTTRWVASFLALYAMALINYYILPDFKGIEKLKRRCTFPGTFFFCCFWLLGSWGFSIYINNLQTYNRVYGTIGAFAMLMVWLYYTSILMIIGGEINSNIYDRLENKNKG
jgi:membrane protein